MMDKLRTLLPGFFYVFSSCVGESFAHVLLLSPQQYEGTQTCAAIGFFCVTVTLAENKLQYFA